MAHQYIPKMFYDPHKNTLPPSYILDVRSLIEEAKEIILDFSQGTVKVL